MCYCGKWIITEYWIFRQDETGSQRGKLLNFAGFVLSYFFLAILWYRICNSLLYCQAKLVIICTVISGNEYIYRGARTYMLILITNSICFSLIFFLGQNYPDGMVLLQCTVLLIGFGVLFYFTALILFNVLLLLTNIIKCIRNHLKNNTDKISR